MKKVLAMVLALLLVAGAVPFATAEGLPQGTGVTLTIYTNSGSDGRGDWLVERAAQDGFTIQYIEGGAAEIQNRLLAEKAVAGEPAYELPVDRGLDSLPLRLVGLGPVRVVDASARGLQRHRHGSGI